MKKTKLIATILAGVAVFTFLAFVLQSVTGKYQTELAQITKDLGILGPIFLCFGVAFGGIIVPMTSLPFLLVALTLYNFWQVFFIFYIGNAIIAPAVDFYIARKWGRGVVAKMAGNKALEEIDRFAAVAGYKTLAVMRIFGGVLFDSISYAVGLTKLDFKKVMLITIVFPIPSNILTILILTNSVQKSPLFMGLLLVMAYGGGLIASWLIYRAEKAKNRQP